MNSTRRLTKYMNSTRLVQIKRCILTFLTNALRSCRTMKSWTWATTQDRMYYKRCWVASGLKIKESRQNLYNEKQTPTLSTTPDGSIDECHVHWDMKWGEVRWDEVRRDEMRWDEMRWDEMRWDEMRWDEMRWDEWDEMRWVGCRCDKVPVGDGPPPSRLVAKGVPKAAQE